MKKIQYNPIELAKYLNKREAESMKSLTDAQNNVQNYSIRLKKEISQILEKEMGTPTLDSLVSLVIGPIQKGKKYFQDKF